MYSHFYDFQQKGLEKGLDNVTGGLNIGLGLLGGGKPDVKNVMNVVSVSKYYKYLTNRKVEHFIN